jgi:hypothetical protein
MEAKTHWNPHAVDIVREFLLRACRRERHALRGIEQPTFKVKILPDQDGSSDLPAGPTRDLAVDGVFGHIAEGDADTRLQLSLGKRLSGNQQGENENRNSLLKYSHLKPFL